MLDDYKDEEANRFVAAERNEIAAHTTECLNPLDLMGGLEEEEDIGPPPLIHIIIQLSNQLISKRKKLEYLNYLNLKILNMKENDQKLFFEYEINKYLLQVFFNSQIDEEISFVIDCIYSWILNEELNNEAFSSKEFFESLILISTSANAEEIGKDILNDFSIGRPYETRRKLFIIIRSLMENKMIMNSIDKSLFLDRFVCFYLNPKTNSYISRYALTVIEKFIKFNFEVDLTIEDIQSLVPVLSQLSGLDAVILSDCYEYIVSISRAIVYNSHEFMVFFFHVVDISLAINNCGNASEKDQSSLLDFLLDLMLDDDIDPMDSIISSFTWCSVRNFIKGGKSSIIGKMMKFCCLLLQKDSGCMALDGFLEFVKDQIIFLDSDFSYIKGCSMMFLSHVIMASNREDYINIIDDEHPQFLENVSDMLSSTEDIAITVLGAIEFITENEMKLGELPFVSFLEKISELGIIDVIRDLVDSENEIISSLSYRFLDLLPEKE